jgi:ParB family chromosome partitioning protein
MRKANTTAETTAAVAEPGYVVGQVYDLDPTILRIGENVRLDTHPGAKGFAASIRARGVLEPVTAWADEDG